MSLDLQSRLLSEEIRSLHALGKTGILEVYSRQAGKGIYFRAGQIVFAVTMMTLFAVARHFAGRLDREWRVNYEMTALLAYYAAGQSLLGLVLVHGFPRLIG